MAKESITITVTPEEEQRTINLYQNFAWELQSSQECSHFERQNDSVYEITSIKLVFSREKNIQNYEQISILEEEFHSIIIPRKRKTPLIKVAFGVYFAGGIPVSYWCANGKLALGLLIGLAVAALGTLSFVFGIKHKKYYDQIYKDACLAAATRREEILNEVQSLV